MSVSATALDGNRLLAGLAPSDTADLRALLHLVELSLHDRLSPAEKPIRHAYFPISGMISLVQAFDDGSITEVGVVGREGFWGTPILLGARSSPVEAMVQGTGQALRIRASDLLAAVAKAPALRARLLKYVQALYVQVSITAACNGRHTVAHRLARWLLEAYDRLDANPMPLTHEFLSYMLGVRRAGVTAAMNELKRKGVISAARNKITIRDRDALKREACECYRLVKTETQRLLPRTTRAAGPKASS